MSGTGSRIPSADAPLCEFCARRCDRQDGSPLCDRCLAEMHDAGFAEAVARALPSNSRRALRQALEQRAQTQPR